MIVAVVIVVGLMLLIFGLTAFVGAPYVPTHKKELEHLFDDLYILKPDDVLLDIGSGDGCVLAAVCEKDAKAIGYEINPILVIISRWRLRKFKGHAQILLRNFWHTEIPPEVTVVYTFGESRDILKMYKKVEKEATRLGKNLYFISYGFQVPGYNSERSYRAHHLYRISPLHHSKA
jgi:hypothetical protein